MFLTVIVILFTTFSIHAEDNVTVALMYSLFDWNWNWNLFALQTTTMQEQAYALTACPLSVKTYLVSLFLNKAKLGAHTMSFGKLFHILTQRWKKWFSLISILAWYLNNLKTFPLVSCTLWVSVKRLWVLTNILPCKIL